MSKLLIVLALIVVASQAFDWKQFSQVMSMEVNSVQSTWTAGHNSHFDGWTHEDIKHLMGTLKAPPHMVPKEKFFSDSEVEAMALPEQFFPEIQWPGCQSIKEIRDQSNCGSCWAFGTVEAISDRICIASGYKLQTRISTENLLSCCRGAFACGMGCNGGYIEASWQYFAKTGIVTGDLYQDYSYCQPYAFPPCDHHVAGQYVPCPTLEQFTTPQCVKTCNPQYKTPYEQDLHFGKSTYKVPRDVAKIQAELFQNGSVTAAFTVYEDFLTYTGGVYQHTGKGQQLGGHAIKILGWGVEHGTPYWYCANSWNNDWGLNGFFKILRGQNECGIEASIVAGLVQGQ